MKISKQSASPFSIHIQKAFLTSAPFVKLTYHSLLQSAVFSSKYSRKFKNAFKKLYMFYFETFQIILNPTSVKK